MWHPRCFRHLLVRMLSHMDGCWKWYFYGITCYRYPFLIPFCPVSPHWETELGMYIWVCKTDTAFFCLRQSFLQPRLARTLWSSYLNLWSAGVTDTQQPPFLILRCVSFSFFQIFATLCQVVLTKTIETQSMTTDLGKSSVTWDYWTKQVEDCPNDQPCCMVLPVGGHGPSTLRHLLPLCSWNSSFLNMMLCVCNLF